MKKKGKEVCVFTVLNEDLCHAIQTFLRRKRKRSSKSRFSKGETNKSKIPSAKSKFIYVKPMQISPLEKSIMTTPNDASIITPAERSYIKQKLPTKISRLGMSVLPGSEIEPIEEIGPGKTLTISKFPHTLSEFPPEYPFFRQREHDIKTTEKREKAAAAAVKRAGPVTRASSKYETIGHYIGFPPRDISEVVSESSSTVGQGRLGRRIYPMAIDSDDIKTIADSNLDKGFFKGVVARDTIKDIKPNKTKLTGFIFNTDKQSGEGIHWRSIVIDPKATHRTCEYFDSFGEAPEKDIREQIDDLLSKVSAHKFQFKVNRVQTQNNTTKTCGWHALKFLFDRSVEKLPFKAATNFNESDVADMAPPFAFI